MSGVERVAVEVSVGKVPAVGVGDGPEGGESVISHLAQWRDFFL
jgi:hypothetical protein